jgi:hypothetical protein
MLGQLITTRLPEPRILGLVARPDLGQNLAGDLLEVKVGIRVRVAGDPRAIDRHHARLHQSRLLTEPQHVSEQRRQRLLMAADEPRDRHMIRNEIAGDHSTRRARGSDARSPAPISANSSAAQITLLGFLNSDRKMAPSGCSRMAVAICRSNCLICSLITLIVATRLRTSARRMPSSSSPTRASGARRSFASSCAGCWRPV